MPTTPSPSRVLPLVALAASGMAGLTYEVVWSRAMAALFGAVLTATGTLLALFMGGLAIGSWLGGRWAARTRRPLAAFGIVELAVGGLAWTTPYALRAAAPWVARLDSRLPDALAPVVPAALSVAILLPLVVLLGATFPLILAWAVRGAGSLGADTGRVYGINTLGAVAGTLLGGFWMLPALGITRSLFVASGVDILVGALCLFLGLSRSPAPTQEPGRIPGGSGHTPLWIAFLGGFAALVLEVAWFRALMLLIGSSVYAISMMLAAFLAGIGIGSLRLSRRADASPDARGLLGRYHAGIGLAATLVTVVLQLLPALYIPLLAGSRGSFAVIAPGSLAIVFLFLLVPTTLMGAALPFAIHLAGAERAGAVYGASSLGSCLGALAGGFLLVPRFGLRGAVLAAVLLSAGAAWIALGAGAGKGARRFGLQAGAVTLLAWCAWGGGLLPWDWRVLTAGYYAYAHLYSKDRPPPPGPVRRRVELSGPFPFVPEDARFPPFAVEGEGKERLLSWEEGTYAQVAVVEEGGVRSLLLNGKADASNGTGDMRTQLLLGHLPVLLAPDDPSGDALVIGLGSGVTAGAVASWPFARITAAEIEPAVARASRFFEAENHAVLGDPRVTLRVDDARRVLDRTEGRLSLVTSEPSNLWMSGVSLLFTREFFELVAERLGERGVLCQWLHLYQVGPDDVRTLLATLSGPFPHVVAWGDGTDLLLVASRSPLHLDPAEWQRRLRATPGAAGFLARAGIRSASDLAAGIVADERAIRAWSAGAPLHTDDRPVLEFSAARRMASDWSGPILASLVGAGVEAGPIPLGAAGRVNRP